jgi:N-acetylmuramoyl-L-alanine amidase
MNCQLSRSFVVLALAVAVWPAAAHAQSGPATLTAIERAIMPDAVRITLSLDREVTYREARLDGPARVFFDLKNVQVAAELKDVVLRYPTDTVRQIRIGRHPNNTVRVVLDLTDVKKYSVFTLYNPFRVIVDCEPAVAVTVNPVAPSDPVLAPVPSPLISTATTEPPPPPPSVPSKNTAGGFSLARQLGLGMARIVIDPGHGGHDPGAQAKGLNEADLTLDVALRLEKLLQRDGVDVVLTRRGNIYVPLEERTAIANRENADLFLSIHVNASRNTAARGVETYFLSFASSPEAEAVAARENSASASGMHDLPDIVKAITLNNKLDESRDFAGMVQEALVSRLRRSNKNLRNLGVKKAPFVVLIGASMPSVLAEISFLTNKQELQSLKTNTYKQRIAEALHASVMRYRRSLKGQGQVADK